MSTGELGSEVVGTAIVRNVGNCTSRYGDEPTENSDPQEHRWSLLSRIELGCNSDWHLGLPTLVRFHQNIGFRKRSPTTIGVQAVRPALDLSVRTSLNPSSRKNVGTDHLSVDGSRSFALNNVFGQCPK